MLWGVPGVGFLQAGAQALRNVALGNIYVEPRYFIVDISFLPSLQLEDILATWCFRRFCEGARCFSSWSFVQLGSFCPFLRLG